VPLALDEPDNEVEDLFLTLGSGLHALIVLNPPESSREHESRRI
jgi:hypothetical protein